MKFGSRLLMVVALAALPALGAGSSAAAADDQCAITGFSPSSMVVGSGGVAASANLSTAGDCSSFEDWSLDVPGVLSTDSRSGGFAFLDPQDNALAGRHDVSASYDGWNASDGMPLTVEREWPEGFSLRRATGWWGFNASPEPVAKGTKLTLEGQLFVADWDQQQDVGFAGATVQVEYRTSSGSYTPIKTVRTDSTGSVRTTVTANTTGLWRFRYLGDDTYGPSAALGDAVDVVAPTACTGAASCKAVKSVDVDGDGKKDSVGVIAKGLDGDDGKITVRVRRATGQVLQTTGDKVHWFSKPVIGAAPVDGVRGSEILVGDQMGAHFEQFRMITYRHGKLVTASPPRKAGISNRRSRWGIDSSMSSNIGLYRSASKRGVTMTVKTAFARNGDFKHYTGKTKVYAWKSGKWTLRSNKTKHYTAKQTTGIGGLHIKGLPRYG